MLLSLTSVHVTTWLEELLGENVSRCRQQRFTTPACWSLN